MSVEAYALRADDQDGPRGIIAPPRFTWRLRDPRKRRGARQVGYRIEVFLVTPAGQRVPVWQRASRSADLGVRYDGVPLVSSADYAWLVEIEDETGERRITEAVFSTGIVHPDEWRAAWIARNPRFRHTALPPQDTDISYTVNKLQPVRRFVTHHELAEAPVRAKIHASAKGVYRLYINGRRVGTDELVPGWTEYRERITYQSWDVTGLLRSGRNSIAALVGDGWYVGFIGTDRRQQAQHYGRQPEFLAQLVIDAADGQRTVIGTDDTWRESASDILYADMLMGQYEDSRRADPGWHRPEAGVESWSEAVVASRSVDRLIPERDPAVRATDVLPARDVASRGDGRFIVDFGQNLVGRVRLRLRHQPADARIQVDHAEVLDEDGNLYTANLRTAEPRDVFWTDGSDEQVFEPRFTLHGFRYAEVSGYLGDLTADDVEAVVIHNEIAPSARFDTSDADINRLFQNIDWGLRGNLVSVPTDCPQRDERLGWLADAQVIAPTALAFRDTAPLLRRWLEDVRIGQSPDGAFPDISPRLIHLREGAPGWGDGGVTVPWNVYRATGDLSVLDHAADSMVAWVRHVLRHNRDLIWREQVGNDYGDWLQVGEETPKDVLATAYFAHSTDLTARSLRLLGRTEEAAELEELRRRIRGAFVEAFVRADGTIEGDTQGVYVLALAFGLIEDADLRRAAALRLVDTVERRGVALTAGFLTVGLLCPVLCDIGREDLATRLLHRREYPSWLFSVRNGATTIWERWDGWTPENGFQSPRMNSFNHYSLGSVGAWMLEGICGIGQSAASAGHRDLEIAPVFDTELSWARGVRETARGQVVSAWKRAGDDIEWTVTIPPGAPAKLVIPHVDVAEVTEGGESATRSTGISVAAENDESGTLIAEPGTFTFRFRVA